MWFKGLLLFAFCIGLFESATSLNQSSFPEGFVFGTASSAYQVLFIPLFSLMHVKIEQFVLKMIIENDTNERSIVINEYYVPYILTN